jgi:hypothetical protein
MFTHIFLRVYENWVMRRIFGPKRKEMAGGYRQLHNEELHNLYISSNIIKGIKSRRMRWAGHVECMEALRNEYKILVRKPEGKRPHVRSRHRWEDNVRMDLKETGWKGVD